MPACTCFHKLSSDLQKQRKQRRTTMMSPSAIRTLADQMERHCRHPLRTHRYPPVSPPCQGALPDLCTFQGAIRGRRPCSCRPCRPPAAMMHWCRTSRTCCWRPRCGPPAMLACTTRPALSPAAAVDCSMRVHKAVRHGAQL